MQSCDPKENPSKLLYKMIPALRDWHHPILKGISENLTNTSQRMPLTIPFTYVQYIHDMKFFQHFFNRTVWISSAVANSLGKKYPLKPVESPTATTCQECTQIYPGVAWKKRAYIKCTYTICNQSSNKSATSMTRLENNLPRNKRHHLHHIVLPAQNFLHCFLELHRILWVCFADIREWCLQKAVRMMHWKQQPSWPFKLPTGTDQNLQKSKKQIPSCCQDEKSWFSNHLLLTNKLDHPFFEL